MTEEIEETEDQQSMYGVIAEKDGYSKQLTLIDLTFGRLLDEIIVPYESDEAFFIDGVPVKRDNIARIKIIQLKPGFKSKMWQLDSGLTRMNAETKKIYGDQYDTRFEHILRTNSTDITAQVIKAFNQKIKPSLKDYLPKREELIQGAWQIFIESMKQLS